MGIFDTLKKDFSGELKRNFIARTDETKEDIIYKYPERQIRMLTQLTVQPDEVALFYKNNTIQKLDSNGSPYTLDTKNIPFLSKYIESATGSNLFIAEVYFITTTEIFGDHTKFGGPIGEIRDPATGLVIGLMVYGQYAVQVVDPEKLIVGLLGLKKTTNEGAMAMFKNLVLKVTKDRIAEVCVKKKMPLTDVTSGAYTEELEQEIIEGLKAHTAKLGVDVTRLADFQVSMKPEDDARIKMHSDRQAYTNMAGGSYASMAQSEAMMGAAEGFKKGGGDGGGGNPALGGMGMGMGFGMAQMFMQPQQQQQQHQQQQQQYAPPPPQAPPPAAAGGGRSVMDRLKELNELKNAGLLSEEEYGVKKGELMKQL